MGNLRNKFTNEEWDDMVESVKSEKNNTPQPTITLNLKDKSITQLNELRINLKQFYSDKELQVLDNWITFQTSKV